MKITRTVVVLDAADITAVSASEGDLLGGTVEKDDIAWGSLGVRGRGGARCFCYLRWHERAAISVPPAG
jgi:hypothetical protein